MRKITVLAAIAIALVGCSKSAPTETPVEAAARKVCMNTIESRATNPKSISYIANDAPITKDAAGKLGVTIKFSAKNEMNASSTMLANCTVSADGNTLDGIVVTETR